MADQEHGLESPDQGHRLCVNNCGFSGSPATQNMCSKCYGDSRVDPTRRTPPMPSGPCDDAGHRVRLDIPACSVTGDRAQPRVGSLQATTSTSQGRCATCRKRIGLTGFRCRCGTTFCGVHRYPERHGCAFDYKAVGREAIAKENPIVKAEKLHYKI